MYGLREYPEAGGLMAYWDQPRRHAPAAWGALVDKILKGANPANLPVAQPTKFELVINLKTAQGPRPHHPASLL
jgi:putative ABC transport system substrate-binding protein